MSWSVANALSGTSGICCKIDYQLLQWQVANVPSGLQSNLINHNYWFWYAIFWNCVLLMRCSSQSYHALNSDSFNECKLISFGNYTLILQKANTISAMLSAFQNCTLILSMQQNLKSRTLALNMYFDASWKASIPITKYKLHTA